MLAYKLSERDFDKEFYSLDVPCNRLNSSSQQNTDAQILKYCFLNALPIYKLSFSL